MNKNLDKREKAAKISDELGGLSEKTVLDTGKKRDVKGSAEAEGQKSDGKRTAKIKSLGVTDVFDSGGADFSPLLKEPEGVYINKRFIQYKIHILIIGRPSHCAHNCVKRGGGTAFLIYNNPRRVLRFIYIHPLRLL